MGAPGRTRRHTGAMESVPEPLPEPRTSGRGRIAVAAAALACVGLLTAIVVLALAVAGRGGGPREAAQATPSGAGGALAIVVPATSPPPPLTFGWASPSEAGALPPAFPGITEGRAVPPPAGRSLFLSLICTQCGGLDGGILRVRPAGGGASGAALDIVRPVQPGEPVQGTVAKGGVLLLVDCRFRPCEGDPPSASVMLLRSDDEGATWRSLGRRQGAFVLVGADAEGIPLVRESSSGPSDGTLYRWGYLTPVAPPAGVSATALASGWWSTATGEYFDLGGRRRFEVRSLEPRTPSRALLAVAEAADGRIAAWWSAGEPANLYLTVFRADGTAERTWSANFRPVIWLDASHVLGTVVRSASSAAVQATLWTPAVFDVGAGTVSPIADPFMEQPAFTAPNSILSLLGATSR